MVKHDSSPVVAAKLKAILLDTVLPDSSLLNKYADRFKVLVERYAGEPEKLKIVLDIIHQLIRGDKERNLQFIHSLHKEILSLLEVYLPGLDWGEEKGLLVYIHRGRKKIGREMVRELRRELPITIVNETRNEDKYVWALPPMAHQIGHNLFLHSPGLKETLVRSLKKAFTREEKIEELVRTVNPSLKSSLSPRDVEGEISRGVSISGDAWKYLVSALNQIRDTPLVDDIKNMEKEVKLNFFKYLWLHWLDNCFADIISILTLEGAALLSCVHQDNYFHFEPVDVDLQHIPSTEEELYDKFLGIRGVYPLFIRFPFLAAVLELVEEKSGRKHIMGHLLRQRLKPVIDILLERSEDSVNREQSFRFQRYVTYNPSISVKVDFMERIPLFIARVLLEGLDEFIRFHHKGPPGNWISGLLLSDQELCHVDDLIFRLSGDSRELRVHQYRHLLIAARFSFELFPLKGREISRRAFLCRKGDVEPGGTHPFCLDYYFKRERYLNWAYFSQELKEKIVALGEEAGDFPEVVQNLDKLYKGAHQYDDVMNEFRDRLGDLDEEKNYNLIKLLKIFLYHFEQHKNLRHYNRFLEHDVVKWVGEFQNGLGVIQAVFENKHFQNLLDGLLEENIIEKEFLDILDKAVAFLNPRDGRDFCLTLPRGIGTWYYDPWTGDKSSFVERLYQFGLVFNEEKLHRSVRERLEKKGLPRRIHHEVWKGKILSRIYNRVFSMLITRLTALDLVDQEQDLLLRIYSWKEYFDHPHLLLKSRDFIRNLSRKIEDELLRIYRNKSLQDSLQVDEIIKSGIKEVCTETLGWIHFKNVCYIHNKLVTLPPVKK